MTETGKKLLDTFDSLPENERQEVALEILRRTAFAEHNVPSESELTAAADEVFLELDTRESQK